MSRGVQEYRVAKEGKKMQIWDKLDEVIGATLLATIALVALFWNVNGNVVTIAVTGIVALLATNVGAKK